MATKTETATPSLDDLRAQLMAEMSAQLEAERAQILVAARADAKLELAREQAAAEAEAEKQRAARAALKEKRDQTFHAMEPFIAPLVDALPAYVEPENFTRKDKVDGKDVQVPAGTGYAFSGEHSITLPDGTVKLARVVVSVKWDDSRVRRMASVPAVAANVLAGLTD